MREYQNKISNICTAVLQQLGHAEKALQPAVLRYCAGIAMDRACAFCGTQEPPQNDSVLVRMTLGEYFFYLQGAGKSLLFDGKDTDGILKTIKEGDVTLSYDTDLAMGKQSICSDELIERLCGAVSELVSERRLKW